MRREWHPQDVGVLELERAGEVVVDLVEAERERLVDRAAYDLGTGRGRLERGQALLGRRGGRAGAGHARRRGQVEGLEHERRDAPGPGAAVVGRVREDQLVAGPGHRHVAQAALLSERQFRRRRQPPAETGRQGQGLAPPARREASRDEPGQEDHRELEPLGLVDRQDGHRIGVRIELGRRRVVARVDERLEVGRDEDRPVVDEQAPTVPRTISKNRAMFAERLLGGDGVGGRQSRQQAARPEEPVQQLPGRPLVRDLAVPTQVREQLGDRRARLRADPQDARLAVQLLEDRRGRSDSVGGPC